MPTPTFTCPRCGHANNYTLNSCQECGKSFMPDHSRNPSHSPVEAIINNIETTKQSSRNDAPTQPIKSVEVSPDSVWEYKVMMLELDSTTHASLKDSNRVYENALNHLGLRGWELVFVKDLTSRLSLHYLNLIFKRRKNAL